MYKIPKKCSKCGSVIIKTETGTEIVRIFNKGKLIKERRLPTTRRIFCDRCYEEQEGSGTHKCTGGHKLSKINDKSD